MKPAWYDRNARRIQHPRTHREHSEAEGRNRQGVTEPSSGCNTGTRGGPLESGVKSGLNATTSTADRLFRVCGSELWRQASVLIVQQRPRTRKFGCALLADKCTFKEAADFWAVLSLYSSYHKFVRMRGMIRVTPAMEAGLTDHVWTLKELLSKIGQ